MEHKHTAIGKQTIVSVLEDAHARYWRGQAMLAPLYRRSPRIFLQNSLVILLCLSVVTTVGVVLAAQHRQSTTAPQSLTPAVPQSTTKLPIATATPQPPTPSAIGTSGYGKTCPV